MFPVTPHCSPGWLSQTGFYLDFAGSGVVHLLGACCSLVGCWFMGARLERYDQDGKVRTVLTVLTNERRRVVTVRYELV